MKTSISFCLTLTALCLAAVPSLSHASPRQGDQSQPTAATTGCGRISVFDVAPRSKDLYRARLLEIDGELAGPTSSRTFRVTPGRHTLTVAELIDDSEFNDVQLRLRGQGRDLSKTVEIEVAPNTTYMLAAHFIESRRGSISDKSYWEPVIYQQNSEPCK
jgi:hypothetical protein